MLSNAYFLAKSRFGTAENEPAKNCKNCANFVKPRCLEDRVGSSRNSAVDALGKFGERAAPAVPGGGGGLSSAIEDGP